MISRSPLSRGHIVWTALHAFHVVVPSFLFLLSTTQAAPPTAVFQDKTSQLGLEVPNAAACWADFNNDGWVDLCASGSVWKNESGKRFSKMAEVGNSVAADFDNDGYVDLFSWADFRIYRNQDGKGFAAIEMPEIPKSVSRGACWGDFNGDGLVDLYVGGYEDWDANITWPSFSLLNQGGKSFQILFVGNKFRTRGVTACDFDQDGDLDTYVSNYRLQPNFLWLNNGTGHFTAVAQERGVTATSPGFPGGHSIGAAWGDFNNDGWFDLFAGNFAHVDNRGDQPKSRILKNLGPDKGYTFEDLGTCGVHYQESYATPAAGDCDNDGNLDVYFTTVYGTASFGRKNNPVLFRNDGQFNLTDVTEPAQLANLGPTYQAAWADYDNDGDLDLLTAGKLFENQGNDNRWLKVRLFGDGKAVNRSAIGAQVRIEVGDKTLTRQVEAGTGEGNQNDLTLHFGVGQHDGPVSLKISWPDKTEQTVDDVDLDQLVTVQYGSSP